MITLPRLPSVRITPEIGSSWNPIFRSRALLLLGNQPKILPFLPLRPTSDPPLQIQAALAAWPAARAAALLRAAVRGCVWRRVVARASSPWLRPGVQRKREERNLSGEEEDSGGFRVWEEEDTERENIFFLRSERRYWGIFGIKVLLFELFTK